jgi:hypothetical protein
MTVRSGRKKGTTRAGCNPRVPHASALIAWVPMLSWLMPPLQLLARAGLVIALVGCASAATTLVSVFVVDLLFIGPVGALRVPTAAGFARVMQGELTLQSADGQGATFTLWLQRA